MPTKKKLKIYCIRKNKMIHMEMKKWTYIGSVNTRQWHKRRRTAVCYPGTFRLCVLWLWRGYQGNLRAPFQIPSWKKANARPWPIFYGGSCRNGYFLSVNKKIAYLYRISNLRMGASRGIQIHGLAREASVLTSRVMVHAFFSQR